MTNKFTWQEGDVRIIKHAPVDNGMLITRLQAAIAQYEMRSNPSPDDVIEYQEAKRLLANLLARRED